MTELSPTARAVLTAVTQRKYSLNPEDVPQLAASIASGVATALRAAADQVVPVCNTRSDRGMLRMMIRNDLFAIADELEGNG